MHQLKDLMSRDVKVISPDMTINEAARTMRDGDFGRLPVGEKRPHDRRDFGSGHCDPSRGRRQRARHESECAKSCPKAFAGPTKTRPWCG